MDQLTVFRSSATCLLVILGILCNSKVQAQVNHSNLDGSWITIENDRPSGMVTDAAGLTFNFNQGSGALSRAGIPQNTDFAYTLQDSTIFFSIDSTQLKVVKITRDSLTLQEEDGSTYSTVRLGYFPQKQSADDLFNWLNSTPFYRITPYGKERIDFTSRGFWNADDPIKYAVVHKDSNRCQLKEHERWQVSEYSQNLFIYITESEIMRRHYHIKSINKKGFEAIEINDYESFEVRFELIKSVSKRRCKKTQTLLSSQEWNKKGLVFTNEIDLNIDSLKCLSYSPDSAYRYQDFYDKELIFIFKEDSTYHFSVDRTDWKEGKWSLTPDCRYIVLENAHTPENYIEILALKKSQLRLEQVLRLNMEHDHYLKSFFNALIDFE